MTESRRSRTRTIGRHTRRGQARNPSPPPDLAAGPGTREFATGERLANRYRIERVLGRGGMGVVYEAVDEELAIPVALKTLDINLAGDREALLRLKREVLLARSVAHPNVCRVYDLGRHDGDRGSVWFLSMELLRGETLRERLGSRGRLAPNEAMVLAEQMAAALGAAHRAGVVHRDFNASNVMLVRAAGADRAVVTDFGIARAVARTAGPHTALTGSGLIGTFATMAPEQLRGDPVGPAADIYALGTVLYEMVTGAMPFPGSFLESASRRLLEDAPPPRRVVPDLDPRWDAVILRCLAREPRDRFARAEDVADALTGRTTLASGAVPGSGRAPRHRLPEEQDAFVGRDVELDEMDHRLGGLTRLLTLLGAGGMGKTRLAVRYGWRSRERWPGGVWFCDLADARNRDGIAAAVADTLGVPPAKEDPSEQVGRAIAGRGRCLVILDNFEHVVRHAADTVGAWMKGAEEATFLVTSRERLNLRGERMQMVEPLSIESGVELFAERARSQRPGLELGGQELESVREVVRLVDAIPLAIELAAARMRILTPSQIAEHMRDRFRLLGGGAGRRHASLQAVLDASWELLRPWERTALVQCAVFDGGFTLEAAEAVLDLGRSPHRPWVVDVVQALFDKSLLRSWVPVTPAGTHLATARFGMFASVQDYALRKLMEGRGNPGGASGARVTRSAHERHGRWYARLGSEDAIEALDRHEGIQRRHALEQELENLIAACRRSASRGDGPQATAHYRAAWAVLEGRGPLDLAVDLGTAVLGVKLEPVDRARVLDTLGQAEWRSGRLDEARAHCEAALAIHRGLRDRRSEGRTLRRLGELLRERGRSEEARTLVEAALDVARRMGDRQTEALALNSLGNFHRDEVDVSGLRYQEALAIFRAVGDRSWEGAVLGNLGFLRFEQGLVEEARTMMEAALAISRETGDRYREGVVLGNFGLVNHEAGRHDEARACLDAALALLGETGHRRFAGFYLGVLGNLDRDQGRLNEARDRLEKAIAMLGEMGSRGDEGIIQGFLGDLHLQEGRRDEAGRALARGESLLRGEVDQFFLGRLLCTRARFDLQCGDAAGARSRMDEVRAIAARIGAGPDSPLRHDLARLDQALELAP